MINEIIILHILTELFKGPMILQSHMAVIFIWMMYATTVTLYHHCGYDIPYFFFLFPPVAKHDFHHEKPLNQMFGKYGLMDHLFGTDRLWRQSQLNKLRTTDKQQLKND